MEERRRMNINWLKMFSTVDGNEQSSWVCKRMHIGCKVRNEFKCFATCSAFDSNSEMKGALAAVRVCVARHAVFGNRFKNKCTQSDWQLSTCTEYARVLMRMYRMIKIDSDDSRQSAMLSAWWGWRSRCTAITSIWIEMNLVQRNPVVDATTLRIVH